MSAIKDGRLPIELGGKTRHLLFSLNVLDDFQERFGDISRLEEVLSDPKSSTKTLRWLLTLMLNEGQEDGEPELTERQVGRMIPTGDLMDAESALFKAFLLGTSGTTEPPKADKSDDENGDGEKN